MAECLNVAGHCCSMAPCPGASNPAACDHLARLAAWRSLSTSEQVEQIEASRPSLDPAYAPPNPHDGVAARPSIKETRALQLLVRKCVHRTAPTCGCTQVAGKCGLGKGDSGAVYFTDCMECKKAEMKP